MCSVLNQILMKVLSKEPSSRYRTADQLGRVLLTFNQSANGFAPSNPVQVPNPMPAVSASSDPLSSTLPPEPSTPVSQETSTEIDWGSIGLGMLALAAVGGLIPFWLFVYFSLNPPVR